MNSEPASAALVALVPGIMTEHPDILWRFDDVPDGFRVALWSARDPERTASVRVHRGGEVFVLGFGPYAGPTFEYDEEEKPDELRARLATAVAAVRGPSRLVLTFAGDRCTSCELVLAAGLPEEVSDGTMGDHLARMLAWRLLGRRLRRETIELDRI
ncbi:hypothetical protein [Oerskovia jenensis]|uniref:hypothetical protein n=1 Tax=Oerskovia jenensis TaxID=162169 RepID=UPI0036DCDAF9